MFTGLVEDVGKVVGLDRAGAGACLHVSSLLPFEEIALGDSVAVNGACLTVVGKSAGKLSFDVSPETMERTERASFRSGAFVNLERALRFGDRLGGHLVSGHVDCVALVRERRENSGNYQFSFRLPGSYGRYVIEKGSVAVDGISLTVNTVTHDGFTVNAIPHTADHTTLRFLKAGDKVNIETDLIGKYVERLFPGREAVGEKELSLELLAKSGFL